PLHPHTPRTSSSPAPILQQLPLSSSPQKLGKSHFCFAPPPHPQTLIIAPSVDMSAYERRNTSFANKSLDPSPRSRSESSACTSSRRMSADMLSTKACTGCG